MVLFRALLLARSTDHHGLLLRFLGAVFLLLLFHLVGQLLVRLVDITELRWADPITGLPRSCCCLLSLHYFVCCHLNRVAAFS